MDTRRHDLLDRDFWKSHVVITAFLDINTPWSFLDETYTVWYRGAVRFQQTISEFNLWSVCLIVTIEEADLLLIERQVAVGYISIGLQILRNRLSQYCIGRQGWSPGHGGLRHACRTITLLHRLHQHYAIILNFLSTTDILLLLIGCFFILHLCWPIHISFGYFNIFRYLSYLILWTRGCSLWSCRSLIRNHLESRILFWHWS